MSLLTHWGESSARLKWALSGAAGIAAVLVHAAIKQGKMNSVEGRNEKYDEVSELIISL